MEQISSRVEEATEKLKALGLELGYPRASLLSTTHPTAASSGDSESHTVFYQALSPERPGHV